MRSSDSFRKRRTRLVAIALLTVLGLSFALGSAPAHATSPYTLTIIPKHWVSQGGWPLWNDTSYSFQGFLTNATGGPVSGAQIQLYCTPPASGCSPYNNGALGNAITNSSGGYYFPGVPLLAGLYHAYTVYWNGTAIVATSPVVPMVAPGLSLWISPATGSTHSTFTFTGHLVGLNGSISYSAVFLSFYYKSSLTGASHVMTAFATAVLGNYSASITGFTTSPGFPVGSYLVWAFMNYTNPNLIMQNSNRVNMTVTTSGDALTLGVLPGSGTPATFFTFSGALEDANGNPIQNAVVQLYCPLASCNPLTQGVIGSALTDAAGIYMIQDNGFPAGNYTVYTVEVIMNYTGGGNKIGATSHSVHFSVSSSGSNGGSYSLTTLSMTSSSTCVSIGDTFTLTAFAKNLTTGQPISGISVAFKYALNSSAYKNIGSAVTKSDGYASISFTSTYNGSYVFAASATIGGHFYVSTGVLVQTGIGCAAIPSNCGFLGLGCVLGNLQSTFSGLQSAFQVAAWGGLGGIANFFTSVLNPMYWLNKLGFGWIVNAFGYMVDAFIIFLSIVIATLPYLGFIILMINLFYVVQFDFEGLMGFWTTAYQIVAMLADAMFNFVQIIIDMIQAIEGGGSGGIGAAAAGA